MEETPPESAQDAHLRQAETCLERVPEADLQNTRAMCSDAWGLDEREAPREVLTPRPITISEHTWTSAACFEASMPPDDPARGRRDPCLQTPI